MIRFMMGHTIKPALRGVAASFGLASGYSLSRLRGRVAILMYHRVATRKELQQQYIQPGMYVRDDVFELQLSFLRKHFQILSLHALLDLWREKTWDPGKRYCVLTFDDGWRDNYLHAFPILTKYSIPATIFLPTALIGTDHRFWQDRLGALLRHSHHAGVEQEKKNALRSLWNRYPWAQHPAGGSIDDRIDSIIEHCKALSDDEISGIIRNMAGILGPPVDAERSLLSWDEVREMSDRGMSFGSHSCTHKILPDCSDRVLRDEIQNSLLRLQNEGINYVPVFCYPNGDYNGEITKHVKAAGYRAALSTRHGLESGEPQDQYGLKRIGIHNDMSSTAALFAYRISGIQL
jgi:peptidoglycan/xylan/chitin deacetylase (PgdA/CDA1 family)